MPQIAQLLETYASQIFWLLIVFGAIYFGIGRGMLPKIEATVDARQTRVAGDLAAAEAALLCFDEFQVHDIADAMILGRLFEALFARGVVVVATSNTLPDDLFKGRPGRDAFLPFIALIKQRLDVLVLDAARDYRRERILGLPTWHTPLGGRAERALDAAFKELTGEAESLVDLEGAVDVGVVDEPLPADSRARFLRRWASDTQRADAVRERRASLPRWKHIST